MWNKKVVVCAGVLVFLCVLGVAAITGAQAQKDDKINRVPDEYAARLLRVQHAIDLGREQEAALGQQYQQIEAGIKSAGTEIEQIKKEALKAAGRDEKTWDINLEAKDYVQFVAKPTPPTPPPPAAPPAKTPSKPAEKK